MKTNLGPFFFARTFSLGRSAQAALFAASALCGACGGGGGGDSGTSLPPVNGSPPIAIDGGNADDVSGVILDATLGVKEISDLVGAGTGFAASGDSGIASDGFSGRSKTTVVDNIPCSFGGQLTVSAEVDDPNAITPGDAFDAQFSSCDEGAVINGAFSFVIADLNGSPQDIFSGRFSMAADVIAVDFSITDQGERVVGNGDFSFAIDTTTPPVTTIDLSGNTFSTADSRDTLTLTNFAISSRDDAGSYTLTTDGTVDSTTLQGSVTFRTTVTFEGFGEDYPFAGELLATGADGSTVRLIAMSATDVRLEVDSDGDGAVDEVVDTTWDALVG